MPTLVTPTTRIPTTTTTRRRHHFSVSPSSRMLLLCRHLSCCCLSTHMKHAERAVASWPARCMLLTQHTAASLWSGTHRIILHGMSLSLHHHGILAQHSTTLTHSSIHPSSSALHLLSTLIIISTNGIIIIIINTTWAMMSHSTY